MDAVGEITVGLPDELESGDKVTGESELDGATVCNDGGVVPIGHRVAVGALVDSVVGSFVGTVETGAELDGGEVVGVTGRSAAIKELFTGRFELDGNTVPRNEGN